MRISVITSTAKQNAASRRRPVWFLAAAALVAALSAACASAPSAPAASPGKAAAEVPLLLKISQQAPSLPHPATQQEFPDFFASVRAGAQLPGLVEGAVPQGLAIDDGTNEILISAYFDGSTPSAVFALDRESGRLVKTVWLETEQGAALHGHVGGIAVGAGRLWVASDEGVYEYPLEGFRQAPDGILFPAAGFQATPVVASFATYDSGTLWVGEFAYYGPGSAYRTEASHHLTAPDGTSHHALLAGFRIDPTDGSMHGDAPERVISIPDRVQGAAFSDGRLYLSQSYGRRNKSTLLLFDNPLANPPAGVLSLGKQAKASLWYVDRVAARSETTAPPMMEGITVVDGRLLILFESGAEKYRYTGLWSVDRLYESGAPADIAFHSPY